MTSMLVDPRSYPLSEPGASYLAGATFGHVIDGEFTTVKSTWMKVSR